MTARELLQQGNLTAAIQAATQDVKATPGDTRARIFLFELLAAAGEFERAQKHLDVVAEQAPGMVEGVRSYRGVLAAELARTRMFATGEGAPQRMTLLPLDPEPSLTALRRLHVGAATEAADLLARAAERRPARPGTLDGRRFEDFYDADDVLAPFLEVIANGLYGWVPFAQIAKLAFEEPRFLRDLLWRSVTVTLIGGESSNMFVPVRYPGSERSGDDRLRLGRATDWHDAGGVVRGVGQHTLVAGDDPCLVLEAREITFDA
jgi:type VI secretion system protein ImpE